MGCGALRRGVWKIDWVPPPKGPGKWQLYDLSKDRGEMDELAGVYPEKLAELVDLWKKYAKDVGVVGLRNEIEEFRTMKVEENPDRITWLQFMEPDRPHHDRLAVKT